MYIYMHILVATLFASIEKPMFYNILLEMSEIT